MSQRRTVSLDFFIPEKVTIKELSRSGHVTGIFMDGSSNIQYKVRYFDNAEAREIYFYGWELESAENA
jgi:hypothetical protein